ncbi:MAG: hypothetical protein HUJ26_19865 [Planctomycetaceae bacterium]|nr:hypothetical protein [Planctomycetaceae bacterium]
MRFPDETRLELGRNAMQDDDKRQWAIQRLVSAGWEEEEAQEIVAEAIDGGQPILETLSFLALVDHLLLDPEKTDWISRRAENPDSDHHELIQRLLNAGAAPRDLVLFARAMQQQFLGDLACVLDGSGIYGTPEVPCEDFRVFAVDDEDQPVAMIDQLHESTGDE